MAYTKEDILNGSIPQHVAVIMDGNGRWAKQNNMPRLYGHRNGIKAVRQITEAAAECGVKYLTLYAFSTENWNRPAEEVKGLMQLLVSAIENETQTLMKNNVRLLTIGNTAQLPADVAQRLNECIRRTASNTGLTLVLALSYSSRWELQEAIRSIAAEVADGRLNMDNINDQTIAEHLTTRGIPDPDLLIRTSGETRISNFLLWQIAYTELYFTPSLWPDFGKADFYEAVVDFQKRERRFGKTSEQVAHE